jgi:hypothetical protein
MGWRTVNAQGADETGAEKIGGTMAAMLAG